MTQSEHTELCSELNSYTKNRQAIKLNQSLPILLTFLAAIVSLYVRPGYRVFNTDQVLYLPPILQALKPELFTRDLLLSFNQVAFTYWDEIIIFFVRHVIPDLLRVLWLGCLVSRWIYFYAIFRFAKFFGGHRLVGLGMLLVFFGVFNVYDVAGTFDLNFLPRTLAFPLSLLSLTYLFEERHLLSGFLLMLAVLVHPLSTIPFLICFYFEIASSVFLKRKKEKILTALKAAILPLLSIISLFYSARSSGNAISPFVLLDKAWKDILLARTPYIFAFEGRFRDFLQLAADMFFVVVILIRRNTIFGKESQFLWFKKILAVTLLILALYGVGVAGLKSHFLTSLQLLRAVALFKHAVITCIVLFILKEIKKNSNSFAWNFAAIGTLFSLILPTTGKEDFSITYEPLLIVLTLGSKLPSFAKYSLGFIFFLLSLYQQNEALYPTLKSYYFLVFGMSIFCTVSLFAFRDRLHDFIQVIPIYLSRLRNFALIFIIGLTLSLTCLIYRHSNVLPVSRVENHQVAEWIVRNTKPDDLFLTEPFSPNSNFVRLLGNRAIYVSQKDGAQAIFNRSYAFEWSNRMKELDFLEKNPLQLLTFAKKRGIQYCLSQKELPHLENRLKYKNNAYYVYAL